MTLLFTVLGNLAHRLRSDRRWKEGQYRKQLDAFATAEMICPPRPGYRNLRVMRSTPCRRRRWIRAWLDTAAARRSVLLFRKSA